MTYFFSKNEKQNKNKLFCHSVVKMPVNTFDYHCSLTGGNIFLRADNMFSQKTLSNFTNELATAMLFELSLN